MIQNFTNGDLGSFTILYNELWDRVFHTQCKAGVPEYFASSACEAIFKIVLDRRSELSTYSRIADFLSVASVIYLQCYFDQVVKNVKKPSPSPKESSMIRSVRIRDGQKGRDGNSFASVDALS